MNKHTTSPFVKKLEIHWAKDKFVCIGLDPTPEKLPAVIKKQYRTIDEQFFQFNKAIIDLTYDLVCAYKPQVAHYEEAGELGWRALIKTRTYLLKHFPQIPVILDAKRADIGSTNDSYVKAIFDNMKFDAVTVHPYLGREALQPFLKRKEKGIIVLVRTSNPGAGEFQDIKNKKGEPLYLTVAKNVAMSWNVNGNCALVVGATYPKELAQIRKAVGDIPILIPGIGVQGGNVEETVKAGRDSKNQGIIIHSSRSIIFASSDVDFADAARQKTKELSDQINRVRQNGKKS
ncbi:MAG: orotidine-5'-phosphate decarboxylase [Candidatus Levybacteria bacterium]|nr:orotidine-5'-phosphate decarboxylase [Candidatus Levybacteria bacterium]